MRFSADNQQKTAIAVICIFFLLAPMRAAADTFSTQSNTPLGATVPFPGDSPGAGAHESQLDLLRDRAIEESIVQSNPSATTLSPFRAPLQSHSRAATSEAQSPGLMKEISNTVKETLRPTYEDALKSGMVSAIRSVTLGDRPDPSAEFTDVNSGKAGSDPRQLGTQGKTWDTPDRSSPLVSAEQHAENQIKAEILLMALIDEIKPWALSAAVLYGLFHLAKFGLAYHRRKAERRRRRHRSGAGSSRSSRSRRHHTHPAADS